MVDAVLYFEGDRGHQFRILRAVKNRFGPTDEIGVFEMTGRRPARGHQSVRAVPADQRPATPGHGGLRRHGGHAARCSMEVQALVAPSPLGTPRRAVVGWDSSRLSMVLAVLEARGGVTHRGK